MFCVVSISLLGYVTAGFWPFLSSSKTWSVIAPVPETTRVEIERMTLYSRIAYCPDNIDTWKCGKACLEPLVNGTIQTSIAHAEERQISGFVAYNARIDSIIVSFKGSSNARNFLDDLYSKQVDCKIQNVPGMKVHAGFQDSYFAIRDSMMDSINSSIAKHPNASIRITGHSLGAAMAALCAFDIVATIPTKAASTSLYTFGQPRVGNAVFANTIDAAYPNRIYRTTKSHDIVTQMPTPHMFQAQWQHHSTEININEKQVLNTCLGQEDDSCSSKDLWESVTTVDGVFMAILNPETSRDIDSHLMKSYLGREVEC